MGVNSIRKGNKAQVEVAKMFSRWFPGCQSSSHAQRNHDSKLPDIIGGGIEEHFYVEVKRYKKIYPRMRHNWINKAVVEWRQYYLSDVPEKKLLIVSRMDRDVWRVYEYETAKVITWEEFEAKIDKHLKQRIKNVS